VTSILGISAFYHDSAAALVVNGKIVAAAQEERFSRKKHDARYPYNAIKYVLDEAGRFFLYVYANMVKGKTVSKKISF